MDWSVDRSLGVGGVALATVLLVLDKAGKLKGPVLLVLLGIALCMMIPTLFSVPWVAEAGGLAQFSRRALMLFIVGILWAILSVWVTSGDVEKEALSNDSRSQHNDEKLRSYLTMGLVIDEVSKDFIQFHLTLKNDGPLEIKISQLVYKSLSQTAVELNIGPIRTIIPGGHLVSNGRVMRSDGPGPISATATYNMRGSEQPITVTYGFRVRAIDLNSKTTLEPESREEIMGMTLVPMEVLLNGLKQQVGSLTSWFPEKKQDGTPNAMIISAAPNREIGFDPDSRTVHLTMSSGGKIIQLRRPLLEPKDGFHFIAATWDDSGDVHLYVDGSQ